MASKKRGRDSGDAAVEEALMELSATCGIDSSIERKIRALDKVIALVDPGDDTYTTQRALVDGDAAFYLTELLADASVAPRAAEAVAALTAHSAAARARLAAGPLMGLDSSVERVSLNPCQADFVDSGAVAALVPLLLARQEAAREAAGEALGALCSYHQEGKLAQLEALVATLQRAPDAAGQIFELLDALLDGMECGGDEAGQQLELLRPQLLAALRARAPGGAAAPLASLSLLATLCERRPDAVEALLEGGAAAAAAQHLLHGGQVVQDAAARALWRLLKGRRRRLAEEGEALLGCPPAQLAPPLVQLIETADAEEARARDDLDAAAGGSDSGSDAGGAAGFGPPPATPTAVEICHAEEASCLLRDLARCSDEVAALVAEREVPLARGGSACAIM